MTKYAHFTHESAPNAGKGLDRYGNISVRPNVKYRIERDYGSQFEIRNHGDNNTLFCITDGCAHLYGGSWIITEQ